MGKKESEQELSKKVEDMLSKVRSSFGGADVRLREIRQGVVTLKYYRPLSNPSACHVDRTLISKEIVEEVLEDQLKKMIPHFQRVVLVENW
jgi:hypothetical protein